MRKRRENVKRALLMWISLLLVASVLSVTVFFKIKPLVYTFAKSVAETRLLCSANQAILNVLERKSISYDGISRLSKNADGGITGVEIDVEQVNMFKSAISNEMAELAAKNEFYTVRIPVGTLLGNEYLTGVGPRIPFRMQCTETTIVDFESRFEDAGINQVLHQIVIKLDITVNILMIGCTESFSLSTTAIAAQTVIVGAVPDAFTNVIERQGSDIAGDIFDYAVTG